MIVGRQTQIQVSRSRVGAIGACRKAALLAIFSALLVWTPGTAVARDSNNPAPAAPAQTYTFSFQDADISAVASEILGGALGLSYTVDPSVTGKISFRIDQRLTKIQLLEAFEAALATDDVALVHLGDRLILEPPAKARVSAGLRGLGSEVHQAGYQVLAAPLDHATPSEVAKVLEAVAPEHTVLYADDKLGLLILGGSAQELQSALDTVKVLDRVALDDAKIRWFPLTKASAQAVAGDLEKLTQASGMSNLSIVPLKRLNGLFVYSRNPAELDFIAKWIDRLDQASQNTASSLWVYHPHNVSAEALSHTLSALLSSGAATAGSAAADGVSKPPASGAEALPSATDANPPPAALPTIQGEDAARFSVDKDSNTLLISAPLARWIALQQVLSEIDRPPRQVLIEASILEVTLTRDFHFGIDWSVLGSNKRLNVREVANSAGSIAASYPGFSATFLSGTIQAAITALGAHSDVEVVSDPKIVALDNHTAKLEVGDQVPIITQSSQSTVSGGAPVINSVDYRNTGVILNVTPRISGENKVVLDIAQEVSSVARTTTSGINSPTIQERKLESTLILPDGGVVALGGLISSNRSKDLTGIPFVQDVPLLGALFRGDTRAQTRTELVVLLTARILPDPNTSNHALMDLAADMAEIKARGLITARP